MTSGILNLQILTITHSHNDGLIEFSDIEWVGQFQSYEELFVSFPRYEDTLFIFDIGQRQVLNYGEARRKYNSKNLHK